MSTCRDCFNCDLCTIRGLAYNENLNKPVETVCRHFKDKSKIVELPCEVGETVYALAEPCGGCECFNNPMKAEYIERCKHCEKTEIIPLKFSLDLYDEVGKTVFTSKEAAEKALSEYYAEKNI